jgi:hypothetical protein
MQNNAKPFVKWVGFVHFPQQNVFYMSNIKFQFIHKRKF